MKRQMKAYAFQASMPLIYFFYYSQAIASNVNLRSYWKQ